MVGARMLEAGDSHTFQGSPRDKSKSEAVASSAICRATMPCKDWCWGSALASKSSATISTWSTAVAWHACVACIDATKAHTQCPCFHQIEMV